MINPPPPRPPADRDGRAVLAPGFLVPAPHGHSLRTGLRVVPLPVALRPAPTSHSARAPLLATTHDIIHANLRPLIFLPSDPPAVKPAPIPRVPNVRGRHTGVLFHRNPSLGNQFGVADGAAPRMRPADGDSCCDSRPAMLRP